MKPSLIQGYVDASGQAVQPFFAAFMIDKGYSRACQPFEKDGHHCEYMQWNNARWKDFRTARNIPSTLPSSLFRNEFTQWLDDRAEDAACRNYVEGATP